MRRVIVSYSQPIRFVRLVAEHAQSDGKPVNRELPVLDPPRGSARRAILCADQRGAASWDGNVNNIAYLLWWRDL